MASYWLLKTEPETYSFSQLLKDKRTNWNGVRNFQARNFLKAITKDDLALIYHSGDDKAVVGVAKVLREAYPDPDPETPGDWVQVDLAPIERLDAPVELKTIKATKSLGDLLLVRQSRLSVMPVSPADYRAILKLSKK